MLTQPVPTLLEKSVPGRRGAPLPPLEVEDATDRLPREHLRPHPPALPELSEGEVARHYTALARRNYGVDSGSYPLGSCTMKYNPKVHEELARLPGFVDVHPLQDPGTVQGLLRLLRELMDMLAEITGMDAVTLQPAAGAHGELCGILMIQAYHRHRGEGHRDQVIVPDSAHGTNPATASMAGYHVVTVPTAADGNVDLDALRQVLSARTAALMLTNPSTLGLFETRIVEIAELTHAAGGLLYYDGANLNAILGRARPGDMGFDVVHVNLHKTFATPHGGGGPGSGPVAVKEFLSPFLPVPRLVEGQDGSLLWSEDFPLSIGRMRSFYGNVPVLVRAYAYLRTLGTEGLRRVADHAVLNANYLATLLDPYLPLAYPRRPMHEFVVSAADVRRETGVRALDLAKRLLDKGVHPPTVYFPLTVDEAWMVEPTETETKADLDRYAAAVAEVVGEARSAPSVVRASPTLTPVRRLDEAQAARQPRLTWRP